MLPVDFAIAHRTAFVLGFALFTLAGVVVPVILIVCRRYKTAVGTLLAAIVVSGLTMATAMTADQEENSRTVNAIEVKYGVHVDAAGDIGTRETVWEIDGAGMKCMVKVDDRAHPDPVLVCDGHELTVRPASDREPAGN